MITLICLEAFYSSGYGGIFWCSPKLSPKKTYSENQAQIVALELDHSQFAFPAGDAIICS